MAIKNMNFTWGKCTLCGKNVKIEVNALLNEVKCECETEVKPKVTRRRITKPKEAEDATKAI